LVKEKIHEIQFSYNSILNDKIKKQKQEKKQFELTCQTHDPSCEVETTPYKANKKKLQCPILNNPNVKG
jgi:hypothetical protein